MFNTKPYWVLYRDQQPVVFPSCGYYLLGRTQIPGPKLPNENKFYTFSEALRVIKICEEYSAPCILENWDGSSLEVGNDYFIEIRKFEETIRTVALVRNYLSFEKVSDVIAYGAIKKYTERPWRVFDSVGFYPCEGDKDDKDHKIFEILDFYKLDDITAIQIKLENGKLVWTTEFDLMSNETFSNEIDFKNSQPNGQSNGNSCK